jgi:hypothetical protein
MLRPLDSYGLLPFECETEPETDQQRPTHPLEPATDGDVEKKPAHLLDHDGHDDQPQKALDIMNAC